MPLAALVATLAGFLIAYLIAEVALYGYQHPLHWVAAFAGSAVGYLIGLLLQIWKTTT
jgi:hypothetical protein